MSSSSQGVTPSTGRTRTPVPPAFIPVDGAFKRNVPPANPLSNSTPTTPTPTPQTAYPTEEPTVFRSDPVHLGDYQQNSNTISASGESASYRTVPVANSVLRGDRIMLQNSLDTSGDSVSNNNTPNRLVKNAFEATDKATVEAAPPNPSLQHDASQALLNAFTESSSSAFQGDESASPNNDSITRPGSRAAVFSSQEGVAPLSPGVKSLRDRNILCSILLVAVAVVLAVIGGVCIGVVSQHYTKVASVKFLGIKNRIVLNSSLARLTESSDALVRQSKQLERFVLVNAQSLNTPATIRDDLRQSFLNAWMLWLTGGDAGVSLHSIKVPFCDEDTGLTTCDKGMLLSVQCDPPTETPDTPPSCFFYENTDNGTSVNIYALNEEDDYMFSVGDLLRTDSYANIYGYISVNTTDGLFLVPSYVHGPNHTWYYFLKFAEQNRLPGGQVVFTETGSFLNTWFVDFHNNLQSADDSISLLFMNNGTILEYDYGVAITDREEPCLFADGTTPAPGERRQCGGGAGGEADAFVSTFLKQLPDSVLEEDVIKSSEYSLRLSVKKYMVAYQDFLRFRTPMSNPNIVFFAAYATPIDESLGHEGVIQIVICVVIIVACVLVLGFITFAAVKSLQRVVEMVSIVASYAATYDTDAMLRVLKKPGPKYLPTSRASIVVRQEFFRILDNLTAYRSFLPPALLTAEALANASDAADSQHNVDLAQHVADFSHHNDDHDDHNGHADADVPMAPLPVSQHPSSTTPSQPDTYLPRQLMSQQSTQVPAADSETDVSASTSIAIYSTRSEAETWVDNPLAKPAVNSRLAVAGLRSVKGTAMVVYLCNADAAPDRMARLINSFVKISLEAAAVYSGVVDVLDATRVVVTFNCHFTTPRHAEKACKCAQRIKRDLKHSGCAVAIGISTGTNYIGTIGTDKQKARVVTGECVAVAHALASLRHYLGNTILATESTAHVSTCASVPVDVVTAFTEGTNTWRQYIVWEVLDVASVEMDPQAALTKKLFRMIRSYQGKAALAAAEAYVKEAAKNGETITWRLSRMLTVLQRHQALIARGYVRCLVFWQPLEVINATPQTTAELEKTFLSALGDVKDDDSSTRRPSDDPSNRGTNPDEETIRVRQLLGAESSRISATKRRIIASHQPRDSEDSDDALFDVYMPAQEEPDLKDSEGCTESAPPSTSQRTTAAEPLRIPSLNTSSERAAQCAVRTPTSTHPTGMTMSGDYGSIRDGSVASPIPATVPVELVSGAGQRFYRTNEVLGHGTYGHVFLAISQRGLFVAAKVFPVQEFNTTQLIGEVETLAQLRSDYIVAYDCCGAQNGYFFICTEYLAGGSLRNLIKNVPCLPPSVVRKYTRDILLALQYLHGHNWTHCDIKPDNVLLSGDGVCKLADFGNAALARSWCEQTSSMRGTARYMAPEAVLSEWKPPADVFSLGITMAYMLTGHQPWHEYPERDHLFVARYAGEIRHAMEKNEPCAMQPDLSMPDVEAVDPELCQIVRACCAFHAKDRPTVDALLNYMT